MRSRLERGLYVSCQPAGGDESFYDLEFIRRMATAAEFGGARALRIEGVNTVQSLRKTTELPVIGLVKQTKENDLDRRNITTSLGQAVALFEAGTDIVAIDFTYRGMDRPAYSRLVSSLRDRCPGIGILADIATVEEACGAEECGVDFVSTTMHGYTRQTCAEKLPSPDFLRSVVGAIKLRCIAEGGYATPGHIKAAVACGAFGVVVGTAITRPHVITALLSMAFSEELQ